MTRQVCWTYASYTLSFHVAFGLLSVLAPALTGLACIVAVDRLLLHETAIVRMLALIAVTFVTMKLVVVAASDARLTARQWLAFGAWFGMRPALFAETRSAAPRSAGFQPAAPPASCRPGFLAIATGLTLLVLSAAWCGRSWVCSVLRMRSRQTFGNCRHRISYT